MKIFNALIIGTALFSIMAFADFRDRPRLRDIVGSHRQQNTATLNQKTLTIDGKTRSFIVENEKRGANQPVIIMLHGGGGNAQNAKMMSQFSVKARQEGFIIVYPNGTGNREEALLTWNATHCCANAMKNNVNDVKFIDALIDEIIRNHNGDSQKIFVTGMSNGAMMTHKIGINLSHKIAGIATVVGTMFGDEQFPSYPVPALIINGLQDEMIPFNGGKSGGIPNAWDGTPMKPADYQASFWANANKCASTPKINENQLVIRKNYNCPNNRVVKQIIVKDGTHAWYGGKSGRNSGPQPTNSIDATDEIWNFFEDLKK